MKSNQMRVSPARVEPASNDHNHPWMTILDHAPLAFFTLDPSGRFLHLNEKAASLFSSQAQPLLGLNFWDHLFPAEDTPKREELLARLQEGDVQNFLIFTDHPGQSPRTLSLSLARQLHPSGELFRLVGFAEEISREEPEQPARPEANALHLAEEKYRRMIESVSDYAIFMLDASGKVASWNPGAEAIKGYTAKEILGQPYWIFYTPEARVSGEPDRALHRAATQGRFATDAWRLRKDGSRFWANIVISAVRDEQGELAGYVKVVRDMTQHLEAELAVQRQTGFVELLQDVAITANQSSSVQHVIQYALDRVCEKTGWEVGHAYLNKEGDSLDIFSTNLWHLEDPVQMDAFCQATEALSFQPGRGVVGQVIRSGKPAWFTLQDERTGFVRRTQALQCGLNTGMILPIRVGAQIAGVLEFFSRQPVDIDQPLMDLLTNIGTQIGRVIERSANEAALGKSEARFRTIFEAAPLGIQLIELDGHVLESNPAIYQMLGYNLSGTDDRIQGALALPATHLTQLPVFQELLGGEGDHSVVERSFIRRDNQLAWARFFLSRVRDKGGDPQFAIGMLEDITERKQMESELVELQSRLMEGREAERLRLAQELHDGPVQDLYGFSYHLSALFSSWDQDRKSEAIQETLEKLNRITGTLRTICGDLRPPTLAPFGLEKAIRSHIDAFRDSYSDLKIVLELMPDGQQIPEKVRLALYRIYQTALVNVVRHARASEVIITLWVDDRGVLLEVKDNGIGFEKPERWIDLARLGHLGLVGAFERASAAGGRLEVDSGLGLGTSLRVFVPRNKFDQALLK